VGGVRIHASRASKSEIANLQLKHAIKIEASGQQNVIKGLGLGNRARESIQDKPILSIRLQDALSDYGNYELVWNKLTAFDGGIGFSSNRSPCRVRGPQNIAGRQLRNDQLVSQSARLSSLP